MPSDFAKKIHDYAMQSEDNLIVFVRAAQSFGEFQKELISSFLKKLAEKLAQDFPKSKGWEISKINLVNLNGYLGLLSLRSLSWPSSLQAGIEASNACRAIVYGVRWDPKYTDQKIKNHIFNAMNKKISGGDQSEWWPIYFGKRGDFIFCNWSEESTIISMRQVIKEEPPAEILEFFYNELVVIVKALDDCIKNHGY